MGVPWKGKQQAAKLAEKKEPPPPPPKPEGEMKEVEPLPRVGEVWYSVGTGEFWRRNADGAWIAYNDSQFRRYLEYCGFDSKKQKWETISQVSRMMVQIHDSRRVDFAGEVGGFNPGIYEMLNNRVLVTKGPRVPQPKRGSSDTIKTLISQLLGKQWKYFYAWIKSTYEALAAGAPWRSGQALIIAGPSGCGKSLMQSLITEMLGGRCCKPYGYLTGKTEFNNTLFATEHWMVEDEANDTSFKARRFFAAKLKNAIANLVQECTKKGKDSIRVTPFVRMTVTLNDNPESLMVLPPIDEDVRDKMILLKASKATIPGAENDPMSRIRFWDKLRSEIPAFIAAMRQWKIPDDMRDVRWGCKGWLNPDLTRDVDELAPEARLLNLIDTCGFWSDFRNFFEGSAYELEKELRQCDKQGEVTSLLKFNSACGTYLTRLSTKRRDRVEVRHDERRGNTYYLKAPDHT